ncbi:MAG TPA: tyrosine-type recombinase/integrase, partial [Streptosporangiaceae bacterium]|nr:tyrosine-type recombinase/integrase [Streptosporangiaceae bacterium]
QENGGWVGAISLGFDGQGKRQRIKRKAKTKTQLKEKLIQVIAEREAGLKPTEGYTVANAVSDWLARGLKGPDDNTITTNRILAEQHVLPLIGAVKLKELTADDVDDWLDGLTGKLATRSLVGVHSILKRSIRQAQARDKVLRNVAELVTTPKGQPGRPSKAMTFDQAMAMLDAAKSYRLYGYVVVSLLVGIRTEEARALLWSHVVAWVEDSREWKPVTEAGFDHERFAIYVWRSVRAGGDTKTEKSRRTLELPSLAADALREHRARQAKDRLAAGPLWQDHGLVFASQAGTPLDASHVRRAFKAITRRAGLGENWTPRELRHSFVSIMSDNGVPIENIADLVGHASTAVTEEVYRHQLKPVITKGAETMNTIFSQHNQAKSA